MRTFWYFLFIAGAIPVEIILRVMTAVLKPETIYRPLAEALVFVYAFVLAAETLFRISQHGSQGVHWSLNIAKFGAWATIGAFGTIYLPSIFPLVLAGQHSPAVYDAIQIFLVLAALAISVLSYFIIEGDRQWSHSRSVSSARTL